MKNTLTLVTLSVAFIWLQSCGPDTNTLEGKKTSLQKLKTQKEEIQTQIATLEKEIGKLEPKSKSAEKSKRVGIDSVARIDFKHFIEVQGAVDAQENVLALQAAPGIVTQIFVREGDRVGKGQVLYTTDASTYTKQIEVVQSQLDLANIAYQKQKSLWDQNIGSEIQYLQAKGGKETLEKQIGNLRAAIELTKCKSPINGTVDEVRVKLGDIAAPSQLMPGVRVVNSSNMIVKAKLSDSYIGKVKAGDKVMVNFPDINKSIETRVTYVGQTVDKQSRTFNVEVRLANPSNEYKANMITRLLINDEVIKNAIVIPQNIIQKNEKGTYVLVADNDLAVKKFVTTGSSYNGNIEIKEGLTTGDKIITLGFSEVVDGQKITY
jgi:membrane fusion protein (multidrug efflux system)